MPDICMCTNKNCQLKEKCFRYLATPSEYWQSYADFKYDDIKGCDDYWEVKSISELKRLNIVHE